MSFSYSSLMSSISYFRQCDTLQAYAERKAGIFFGIDTAHLKHMGMYHTTAEDLDPAAALAEPAAGSAAFEAGHIHLGAGLREGEVMGTEFRLGLRAEQLFRELCQSTFQVCKGDALCLQPGPRSDGRKENG